MKKIVTDEKYLSMENPYKPNTIDPDYQGTVTDLAIAPQGTSGPRLHMEGGHVPNSTVIVGSEPRNVFTGAELQYGKYSFTPVVPFKCEVIRTIKRYTTADMLDDKHVETVVFIRNLADGKIHHIEIPTWISHHQHFGYEVYLNKNVDLSRGSILEKDTPLCYSPRINQETGEWMIGVNANTILASFTAVIEDAVIISDELADRMGTWVYKTYKIAFGERHYPLNLYGTDQHPRFFPKVGEKVREDGILFAKRQYDPWLSLVELSRDAVKIPCTRFDICECAQPGAEVVDIISYRDELAGTYKRIPDLMAMAVDTNVDGLSNYYREIRKLHKELKASFRNGKVPYHGSTNAFIEATIHDDPADLEIPAPPKDNMTGNKILGRFRRQFNYTELDNYDFEITVKYFMPMSVSDKITDLAGGKGIVAEVVPVDKMPLDEFGNRVHCIMSDNAMLRRTNFNRGLEHYVNAARRDAMPALNSLIKADKYQEAWTMLLDIIKSFSYMYAIEVHDALPTNEDKIEFLDWIYANTLRIRLPVNDPLICNDLITSVRKSYPAKEAKLLMTIENGTQVWSQNKFVVGELYLIRLDKTGRDWSAISMQKFSSFGTITKLHSADRNRSPAREHTIKFMGETERTAMEAYAPNLAKELHDLANNQMSAGECTTNLLTAPFPSNVDDVVDRNKIPYGGTKPIAICNHVFSCGGIAFTTGKK